MIARLKGAVADIGLSHLIIDVNGVGYFVTCTAQDVSTAKLDAPITLFIETIVREDAITLYGFSSKTQQDWFQLLTTKVQGVGAKSAIAMLSTLSLHDLADAIQNGDVKTITRTPGIGPKVAQRVIAELKGKIPETDFTVDRSPITAPTGIIASEAVQSLVSLGFDKAKAAQAIRSAIMELGDAADISSLIRLGIARAK